MCAQRWSAIEFSVGDHVRKVQERPFAAYSVFFTTGSGNFGEIQRFYEKIRFLRKFSRNDTLKNEVKN